MHKKIVSALLAILMTFQLCGGSLAFTSENNLDILIEDSSDFISEVESDSFEEYTGPTLTMPDGTVYYRNDDQRIVREEMLNYQEYEAKTYNSVPESDINTYSLPEVDLNGSSDFGDLSQYATTYGYDFLGTMEKDEKLQQFYNDIDSLVVEFHTNYTLDSIGEVVGTLDFAQYGLTSDDALSVWATYKNDHPLYYWISNSVTYTADSLFLLTDELYSLGETREIYNIFLIEKIKEWKEIVDGETSAYRKALAYHDEIISTIDYAYESDGMTPEDAIWAHNILGVFEIGSGVCESYSKTFQLMLNIVGVENIIVTGDGNGEDHMWNLVKLDDGQWYWCDLTWDDTPKWEWGISYNYFCVNDTQTVTWQDGGWDSVYTAFLSNHSLSLPTDIAEMFLYEIPARSPNEYSGNNGELLLRDCFTVDDFTYAVAGYNTVQLTYIVAEGDVVIPETVKYDNVTYTIISIGRITSDGLFTYGNACEGKITSVYIPKSIKFIWERVFISASMIEEFIVSEESLYLSSAEGVLFTKSLYTLVCYPLGSNRREYYVPDETYEIAYGAFGDYYSPANLGNDLEVITFGKNVEVVGRINQGDGYWDEPPTGFNLRIYDVSAFLNIYNILNGSKIISVSEKNQTFSSTNDYIFMTLRNVYSDVSFYEEYKSIFFVFNKDVSEMIIPDDIQGIEDYCFKDCVNLKELYIPDSVEYFRTRVFSCCSSLKKIRLPKTMTQINMSMFEFCSNLEQIVIPPNVTDIRNFAFYSCESLKSVYFLGDAPSSIDESVFVNVPSELVFYYIDGTSGWTSPTWTGPDGNVYKTEKFVLEEQDFRRDYCEHSDITEHKAVDSTCSVLGHNLYYTCNDCDSVLKEDKKTFTTIENETYTEYLPHTPGPEATEEAPQVCTVCGYVIKDIRFTLGDVNDDGKINLDDVIKLLRHVSKADIITDSKLLAAGDIVEDGVLNLDDVVRLLRYVSKAIPSLR